MTTYIDPAFRDSLLKKPQDRTVQDLTLINANLKSLEALSCLRDTTIRSLCKTVRYVKHESNDVLYKSGDVINCWYILLSGSVFIDGSMFLPRSGFGRRTSGQSYRIHDCLVLETSEMLVIDYPQLKSQKQILKPSQINSSLYMQQTSSCSSSYDDDNNKVPTKMTANNVTTINITNDTKRNSTSQLSDTTASVTPTTTTPTSSVYSCSDSQIASNNENIDLTLNTAITNDDSINIDIDDDLIKACLIKNFNSNSLASTCSNNNVSIGSTQLSVITGATQGAGSNSLSGAYGDDGSVSSEHSMQIKDSVRDCLEKDPKERNEDDIDILFEFMQHFPAFTELTQPIIRQLCACMVLGVVERVDTVVLDHNEKLDSWAVVLNGIVERTLPDGSIKSYNIGDYFGVEATLDSVYHEGVMRTKCDDCQFVLIKQNDYYEILNKSKENLTRHLDNGVLVMVSEHRILNNNTERFGDIVLRGSVDKLIEMLINADTNALIDPTYIDDFLLTYRTFIESPIIISDKLLAWFINNSLEIKHKVYRIVLLWIQNHFNDFETNRQLYEFLEEFQTILQRDNMTNEFRMITIAISTKSKPREIILARSKRNEQLPFEIKGGWDKGYGIYVSKVDTDSKANELGLRKGDQILEVNGQLFQYLPYTQAHDLLTTYTHLSIKVKYNPMAFNEMLLHPEKSPHRNKKNLMLRANNNFAGVNINLNSQFTDVTTALEDNKMVTPRSKSKEPSSNGSISSSASSSHSSNHNLSSKFSSRGFNKIFDRFNKKSTNHKDADCSAPSLKSVTRSPSPSINLSTNNYNNKILTTSSSNNNITKLTNVNGSIENLIGSDNINVIDSTSTSCIYDESFTIEHVLKIYRNDQTFKYLVVHKETSTKEVVMLSVKEFNIVDEYSGAYSLCEVSVGQDKSIKQKRLPDQMNNLADKLPLNARYYLKSNQSSEQFLSDSLAVDELLRDANISFLQLDPVEVAAQLTLRDYCLFRNIESTEYIDSLYKIKSKQGFVNMKKFSDLSNEELYWVVHEILREPNVMKRVKIIKNFIHIAKICKECKNFNSFLAIISGLDHSTVSRLKETWEKVSIKYKKLLDELKEYLNPTRNMLKYRQMLKGDFIQPPIIPFFPLCQKDLTFIKEPNDSIVEGLINFDKLRKLSKGIRSTVLLASSSFDLGSLIDAPTSHSIIFSMFGCTNTNLTNGSRSYNFTRVNAKNEQTKKLYEEAVMVRKVKYYLQNITKVIETNEDRLRVISSTLEYSSTGNTLRRKPPSPNNSNTGSLSSINALNNSHNGSNNIFDRKISLSNQQQTQSQTTTQSSVFGTQSPCAVKKLLSLSETKVKTVKTSTSSTSIPTVHLTNQQQNQCSRILNTNTSGSMLISSNGSHHSSNDTIIRVSPTYTHISPKSNKRSTNSSQSLNKYLYSIPLSNESSSVSTIKLNGKYIGYGNETAVNTNPTITNNNNVVVGIDADSGRASMASNIDQEQYSPIFQHTKAEHQYKVLNKLNQNLYLNPYSQNNSQNEMKILKERQEQKILNNNELTTTLTKGTKLKKSKSQNEVLQTTITDKDDHQDDQVSAV